ncbi:MAG: translation initiation factor IF-3 [Bdellovibrionota bacterium]
MLRGRPPPREREDKTRINEGIRSPQIRVISDTGEQLGLMTPAQAVQIARSKNLDLVEISPGADPPVCKVMDYGKFKYTQKKRAHDAKRHQHQILLKEVKFRPKIEKHDYEFKVRHVREFLGEGHKVKITIQFRGREITKPELARTLLDRIKGDSKDLGEMEARTSFEGRTLTTIINPTGKVLVKPTVEKAPGDHETPPPAEETAPAPEVKA